MFQTKADSHEDISWVSVWRCVRLWVSNKSEFWPRHFLDLSIKLSKFMSFKKKRILMKTFVEAQFRVMSFHEFYTNGNFSEDICWVSVLSYLSLRVSNKREIWWRHLLSLSFKLSKFTSFKHKRIFMKTFVESQFEVMLVCKFQTKANSYEDICWASLWSFVSLWVSKKSEFLWRHLFILSLKLFKFTSFKQNRILMKTFFESQLEVM